MTTFVRQLCNVDRYNLHLVICNSGAVVVRESFLEEVTSKLSLKEEARISQAKEKGKLSRSGEGMVKGEAKIKTLMKARQSKHFQRRRAKWELGRGGHKEIKN